MINEILDNEQNIVSSRSTKDRRQNKIRSLFYTLFKRRRHQMRRCDDQLSNKYVDVHEPLIFVLFSITIFLSATDAMFTMFIVNNGGVEINPFMRYLLELDISTFFWVKFFLTSFGMLFLVSHKNFMFYQVIRGYHILYAVFATYFILVNYELYLISKIITLS